MKNNHLIKLPEILESQVINITVINLGLLIFSILCNNLYWGGYVSIRRLVGSTNQAYSSGF